MITLHYSEFFPTLEQKGKSSLVMFSSSRCGSCRSLKNKLEELEDLFPFELYVIDATDAPGLIEEFSIHHLPQLLLYEDGLFHSFFNPHLRQNLLEQSIEALKQPRQMDPSC